MVYADDRDCVMQAGYNVVDWREERGDPDRRQHHADAAFIVALRNAAPDLIAAVRRADEAEAQVAATVQAYETGVRATLDRRLPPHTEACDEARTFNVCPRCDTMAAISVAFGFARPADPDTAEAYTARIRAGAIDGERRRVADAVGMVADTIDGRIDRAAVLSIVPPEAPDAD